VTDDERGVSDEVSSWALLLTGIVVVAVPWWLGVLWIWEALA